MSSFKKTLRIKVDRANPDKKLLRYSARVLREGGLVAFPTETVYGLGANLLDKEAIKNLYRVKNRPGNKPFTVHIASLKQIKDLGCVLDIRARKLAQHFWPGPLTMVLRSKSGKRVGFRMPKNTVALELIRMAKAPIAAPSANISAKKSPVTAAEVLKGLDGKIDIIIDSGRTDIGLESTVLDMTTKPYTVLREGAVKNRAIGKILIDG